MTGMDQQAAAVMNNNGVELISLCRRGIGRANIVVAGPLIIGRCRSPSVTKFVIGGLRSRGSLVV